MSYECGECEMSAHGPHADDCSHHPLNIRIATLEQRAKDAEDAAKRDAARLEWVLKYGHAKTLGVAQDFDYMPITLEMIDGAIARQLEKAARGKKQCGTLKTD
jgi:hypothetical protein